MFFTGSITLRLFLMSSSSKNTIPLSSIHRIIMLIAILVSTGLFLWAMVLYANYSALRIPFIDYPSVLIPEEPSPQAQQTHYIKNVLLYITFWLQHILMSTFKYKLSVFRKIKTYVLYERYIFNIMSGLVLWAIFSNLQPTYQYVFTIPIYISLPITIVGVYFLVRSVLELGDKILMPYSLGDILNSKSVTYLPYDGKDLGGLKMDGIYSYVRHPLQCGLLSLLMFANGVYTVDKILNVIVMGGGIMLGVRLQEQRMLVQFKGYKEYMERVKAKYIPYLHFIGL